MDNYYIYCLRRPDYHDPFHIWESQPFYIGKGCNGRINAHRKEANYLRFKLGKKPIRVNTILKLWKLGLDFEEETLFAGLTEKQAFDTERKLINKYGKKSNGTGILLNQTDGGEGLGGLIFSEDHIENLRKAHTGYVMPEEQKLKISKANKGKIKSEDTRRKLSETNKKKIIPEEQRKRMMEASIKAMRTDEHRNKMREIQSGKTHSEETRDKLRQIVTGRKATEQTINSMRFGWIKRKEKKQFATEIVRTCPTCNKQFKHKQSNIKYCSHPCAVEATRKKDDLICEYCGKPFCTKGTRQAKYCCHKCYVAVLREYPTTKQSATSQEFFV